MFRNFHRNLFSEKNIPWFTQQGAHRNLKCIKWLGENQQKISQSVYNQLITRDLSKTFVKLSAGVAELEALIVDHVLPIFREYRTTMSDAYPTFKFWDMFVEAANLFLHNIRAEHEGD